MSRMKRLIGISMIIAALLGVGMVGMRTVGAVSDTSNVITDKQVTVIRSRCGDIQATLNRIHESDKVLRVNKGYAYKAVMLDKLMTPLNQRIATNQVDGGKLGKITAQFSQTFEKFDKAYSVYERNLSAAINIDCTKQPSTFYNQVLLAYQSRKDLYENDTQLIDLAKEYKAESANVFQTVTSTRKTK